MACALNFQFIADYYAVCREPQAFTRLESYLDRFHGGGAETSKGKRKPGMKRLVHKYCAIGFHVDENARLGQTVFNTSAAEQSNSKIDHIERSVRFMNIPNVLDHVRVWIALYNSKRRGEWGHPSRGVPTYPRSHDAYNANR